MGNQVFTRISRAIKYWYLPLIAGLIMVAVAIMTFMSPSESYVALSIAFSISFLIMGLFEIFFSVSNRDALPNWGWGLAFGILSTVIGVLLIQHPDVSMATLPFYVGFWVMFRSIAGIGWSLDLKQYGILDWGNIMAVSILGLIFSFILLWNPGFAGLTIVFWTGLAILMAGIFMIYLSLQLRKVHKAGSNLKNDINSVINPE